MYTVAGRRAEGKVWESKRERRQWTSGKSGKRVENGASGRRALASFSTNSEGKKGKGLLRKPTDFMASFVRRTPLWVRPQCRSGSVLCHR